MNCGHVKTYTAQEKFKILPGHRALILSWCENTIKSRTKLGINTRPNFSAGPNAGLGASSSEFKINNAAFSPIVREIIIAALSNYTV